MSDININEFFIDNINKDGIYVYAIKCILFAEERELEECVFLERWDGAVDILMAIFNHKNCKTMINGSHIKDFTYKDYTGLYAYYKYLKYEKSCEWWGSKSIYRDSLSTNQLMHQGYL